MWVPISSKMISFLQNHTSFVPRLKNILPCLGILLLCCSPAARNSVAHTLTQHRVFLSTLLRNTGRKNVEVHAETLDKITR